MCLLLLANLILPADYRAVALIIKECFGTLRSDHCFRTRFLLYTVLAEHRLLSGTNKLLKLIIQY